MFVCMLPGVFLTFDMVTFVNSVLRILLEDPGFNFSPHHNHRRPHHRHHNRYHHEVSKATDRKELLTLRESATSAVYRTTSTQLWQ